MKLKYKSLIFLTLLIFCIGSVCAHGNHSTGLNATNSTGLNATNSTGLNATNSINNLMDKYKKLLEHNKKIVEHNKKLSEENKELKNKYEEINRTTVGRQLNLNKKLKEENEKLLKSCREFNEDNNKLRASSFNFMLKVKNLTNQLNSEPIKKLTNDNKNQRDVIKCLMDKLKNVREENKILNDKNKILNDKNKILNDENEKLKLSKKDVYNSLKNLVSTKKIKKIKNIKCGKKTLKLNEYLKIPLIKEGKKNVIKFKNKHKILPNYVIIAGYKVPKKVYRILFNL